MPREILLAVLFVVAFIVGCILTAVAFQLLGITH